MKEKKDEKLKKSSGITLIALVITIIVLLILASVSIAMLTGDNGILKQANKAKVETRGASVQEVRDLWFVEKELKSAKSLDDVLQELRKQNLLTDEEVAEVKETGQVTIGSRTIVFGGGNVGLVARVIYDNHADKYAIAVGFKDYQVNSDWKGKEVTEVTEENILEYIKNKTQEEQEELYLELVAIDLGLKFDNIEEMFKFAYESGETSKLCTTLNEFAIEIGANSVEEMIMWLGGNEFWEEKLNEPFTFISFEGKIIDPSGNETTISTDNMNPGKYGNDLFESYAYIYEINKNGSYTFNFLGNDGQTGKITVTIDENNPCIVFDDNFYSITLIAGINNFISPEKARVENAIYRKGNTGPKNFDITDRIIEDYNHDLFPEGVKELELSIGKHLDANVILTYDGKEYTTKADFWIPN